MKGTHAHTFNEILSAAMGAEKLYLYILRIIQQCILLTRQPLTYIGLVFKQTVDMSPRPLVHPKLCRTE